MFSVPLLRSHATICLVDRDRLQLYHANRSVILVSSAIDFSKEGGLDKFIAVVIAFRRLSLGQNGILEGFAGGNANLVKSSTIDPENHKVQKGMNHKIPPIGKENGFTVTLGDVISRDPAVIGRSTVVLKATSTKWPNTNLVVKVSWPDSGRVPENEFLEKATKEAKKTDGEWATSTFPKCFGVGRLISATTQLQCQLQNCSKMSSSPGRTSCTSGGPSGSSSRRNCTHSSC